ncbi:hypothetical protein NQ318_010872 [Aromia moschata]|uniref:THAP-type domain-containing protein n=1 Tax=Aromia moschata TaxID=1265417 RepID=A0AAV8XRH5_9CUCU|nr:hypothetical protein NQ318_010872 [Aromia moschata]
MFTGVQQTPVSAVALNLLNLDLGHTLTAERYESWMQAIGRDPKENLSITHNAICSDHFTQDSHISDGSTLQEGGIDLDISRPSTSFVTKV